MAAINDVIGQGKTGNVLIQSTTLPKILAGVLRIASFIPIAIKPIHKRVQTLQFSLKMLDLF